MTEMRPTAPIVLLSTALAAQTAHIQVDASHPASYKIPRTIYGTFLEPILQSTYGGLWAQILANPSLEDGLWSLATLQQDAQREPALIQASQVGLPHPWEPLNAAQGNRYEPRWGDAANSARSMLIMALPTGETGIRQEVYLPVHRVLRYTGSLYAKPSSGLKQVEVSLRRRNHPAEVFAKSSITLDSPDWKRYEFSFAPPAGKLARLEPADFVIALKDESRVLVDQIFLFPADHVDFMDPDMIALTKALRTPLIRFGGNFTSGYHWRDGIGPMDKRVSMVNLAWGIPEYNHFGTDEFLRFCEIVGAKPQIALNLGSGTPGEAADWVKYVNAKTGPGQLWELGNELWGDWQTGYPTLPRAAARTKDFADAVHAVDPTARLIATGQDPDAFQEWNAALLALPAGTFHYLATHFVVGTRQVEKKNASTDFINESAFALPLGLERKLREMKQQIDADPKSRGKVQIAFTEWLFHGNDDRFPRFANLGGALMTAGFLNTLIRTADFVPVADMTGLIDFAGLTKKRSQVFGPPSYWALRMYSTADAVTPIATRVEGPTYDIREGNHRIPEIPSVPYLDVVGALNEDGSKLTLFCVNRHLTSDLEGKIDLAGFVPASKARVSTLAGASIHQANHESHPEAVIPIESAIPIPGSNFTYQFPRTSLTIIELSRR